jgi:hypothetical protein
VESAASQVVHKALSFITDQAPAQQRAAAAEQGPAASFKPGFDSQSFLDKVCLAFWSPAAVRACLAAGELGGPGCLQGMDAISGVGKLMEGFAITLDTVIGQAFEDWGTPSQPGRAAKPRRPAAATFTAAPAPPATSAAAPAPAHPPAPLQPTVPGSSAAAGGLASSGQGDWDSLGAFGGKENLRAAAQTSGRQQSAAPSRQPHITSFMSKLDAASEQEVAEWRRRARQLASELQRVRAQQEEYQRLRWVALVEGWGAVGPVRRGVGRSCVCLAAPAQVTRLPEHAFNLGGLQAAVREAAAGPAAHQHRGQPPSAGEQRPQVARSRPGWRGGG